MRLSSAAPVRIPPWPPDLRLGRPGGYLSPLLVGWLSCAVGCSCCRSACRARLSGRDAVSGVRVICCFTLCGRGVIVGGLRTANGFTAFTLVVLVWPVAVF